MPNYDLIAILGPTASGKTPFVSTKEGQQALSRNSEANG